MSTQAPPRTRDRIVESALRLFSERGTSGTSMRDIAGEAAVTVPGLYYHFASKAELIRAVFAARGFDAVLRAESITGLPPTLEARIAEQARRELVRLQEETEFVRLMARESILQDPDALEVGRELGEAWARRWEEVLAGARDIDPKADLAAAAMCLRTFLWGLFVEFLGGGEPAISARAESFARLLAPALRKRR